MTKKQKLIRAAILLVMLGVSVFLYYRYILIQNVFDQMYYSRRHKDNTLSMFIDHRAMFRRMPQIAPSSPNDDRAERMVYDHTITEYTRGLSERYDDSYLEEGHKITLYFRYFKTENSDYVSPARSLTITYYIDMDGEIVQLYRYRYDIYMRTLTYDALYPELDEYKEYKNFLFDRVLPDFFAANGAHTRFSMDNLGAYTFVDATVEETK